MVYSDCQMDLTIFRIGGFIMNHVFYEQTYGVEIELTGITRRRAAEVIANYYGTRSEYEGTYYDKYVAYTRDDRKWTAMSDGSIHCERRRGVSANSEYSCEVVTPILRYDDMEDLQNVVRALREAGAFANSSCGIHVHVGADKLDAYSITRLANLFLKRQPLINDALQNGYRSNWCRPLNAKLVAEMRKTEKTKAAFKPVWYGVLNEGGERHPSEYSMGQHYNQTRYHGLNLHAWYTKGTVEFRLFNGTNHAGKIKAYVQFCLALTTYAIGTPDNRGTLNARFEKTDRMTLEEKGNAMKTFLEDRLHLTGAEFKTCRLHMTSAFTGVNAD